MASSLKGSYFALFVALAIASVASWHVTYAAAPIIMLFYTGSERAVLWTALLAGLFMDAIELTPRFGLLGVTYLVTAGLLYPARRYFFKDSLITLPAMSLFFSVISQILGLLLALIFDIPIPQFSLEGPFIDLFFAIAVFMLPTIIWHQYAVRRTKRRYSDDS